MHWVERHLDAEERSNGARRRGERTGSSSPAGGRAQLDEGVEQTLYQLVRDRLPDTILVSVSHRTTVEQHHTKELQLLGNGRWYLGEVGAEPDDQPDS